MHKAYTFVRLIVVLAGITASSSYLRGQSPVEDAISKTERLTGKNVIPYPVPPFIISPERAATEPYIDMFVPDEKYGPLKPKLILQLRYEGGGALEHLAPRWIDHCGYELVYRQNRPFGTFPSWDYFPPIVERELKKRPEYTLDQTYRTRIGGMRRADVFEPDEIGRMLSESKVLDSDGPGNNDYESNLISSKYGLRRTIYLGKVDIEHFSAFVEEWEDGYLQRFREKMISLRERIQKWPKFRGRKPIDDPETVYLLFGRSDMKPLEYFLDSVRRDYDAVAAEFRREFGFELPLQEVSITPEEYARRIKFWLWVKGKYGELIKMKSEVLRQTIPKGTVVGNIHFECWQDYERLAEGYDWVGCSIRPALLPENDDLGRLYWMGYGARLFGDLTDKPQMISVRANTLGAGPRVIPSASALTYWHNQAIQNGCVGFYIWLNEYPAYPGGYRGICYGNPDQSTLPKIRWNTHMRLSRQLGQTKVFSPPKAKTVTLVSKATCALNDLGGWKRVFSSYIELCRAKVWNGFVSDQEIWEGTESLQQFKTVYIPAMIFEKEEVANHILNYVEQGGTVICADPRVFSFNLEGEDISHYREELFGVHKIEKRSKRDGTVQLRDEFEDVTIEPYSIGYGLTVKQGVQVLGEYDDGTAAVTVQNYGKGKAYLFGVPILDIYSSDIRTFEDMETREDRSRLAFYKRMEELSAVEDQSWIWDITVHNLHDVTGWVPYEPIAPDESIQFEKKEQGDEVPM